MIHERIYKKLEKLGITGLIEAKTEFAKSVAPPFATLHYDRLREKDDAVTIALAHYDEHDGELCASPDMQVRVHPAQGVAEALTYKQSTPAAYNEVYSGPGKVNLRLKKELNDHLDGWLTNLINQGHHF